MAKETANKAKKKKTIKEEEEVTKKQKTKKNRHVLQKWHKNEGREAQRISHPVLSEHSSRQAATNDCHCFTNCFLRRSPFSSSNKHNSAIRRITANLPTVWSKLCCCCCCWLDCRLMPHRCCCYCCT
ncbi:unnamed protein product [Ceratitis capitata]|uniref:(Mediterranean fruit fly) hypothetical protein n=1 Tax=Ceratitis capitata TaxID=7213 RepID=A0A811U712_CERCA|nr:unnamed protein product [Ceratitis capitata]